MEKAEYCPGEVCDTKSRSSIQKLSPVQFLAILSFIVLVIITSLFFNDEFKTKPHSLFSEAGNPNNHVTVYKEQNENLQRAVK